MNDSAAIIVRKPLAAATTKGPAFAPVLIQNAGERVTKRFWEFFAANIRNKNTRMSYARAVMAFLAWCESRGLVLEQLEPVVVAAYIEQLQATKSPSSVKQHLAAIRMLFDYLVVGQALPFNPAAAVRGPKHVVREGKTPVLSVEEARTLLDSIDVSTLVGLRDRAFIATMLFSFGRVGAVVRMKVKDYYTQGRRAWFRLLEKGGKYLQIPAHHKAAEYMDAYLQAAGIAGDASTPLFRAFWKKSGQITDRPITRVDAFRVMKRRAKRAGLPKEISPHVCRATGITAFLENDGELGVAQRIAGHADPRTTKLYDRRQQQLSQGEIERIRI